MKRKEKMCTKPIAAICGIYGGNSFGSCFGEGKYHGHGHYYGHSGAFLGQNAINSNSLGLFGSNSGGGGGVSSINSHLVRESRLALTPSTISSTFGPYAGFQQQQQQQQQLQQHSYLGLPAQYEQQLQHQQRQYQTEVSPLGTPYLSTCDVLDNFGAMNLNSSPDGYASSGILSGNYSPTEADAHVTWMQDSGYKNSNFSNRRDLVADLSYKSSNVPPSSMYGSVSEGLGNSSCIKSSVKNSATGEYGEEKANGMLLNEMNTQVSSMYKTGSNYGPIGSYPKSGYPGWECSNQAIGGSCGLDVNRYL